MFLSLGGEGPQSPSVVSGSLRVSLDHSRLQGQTGTCQHVAIDSNAEQKTPTFSCESVMEQMAVSGKVHAGNETNIA